MQLLVAVDGSEESENALAYAADIADATDGSITVVHAVDPTAYDEGGANRSRRFRMRTRADPRGVADAEQRGLDLTDEAAAFADELGHDVAVETPLRQSGRGDR